MGCIDKTTVRITCQDCGSSETLTAIEKGSQYGADWTGFTTPKHFSITETASKYGPEITEAKCIKCHTNARIETQ